MAYDDEQRGIVSDRATGRTLGTRGAFPAPVDHPEMGPTYSFQPQTPAPGTTPIVAGSFVRDPGPVDNPGGQFFTPPKAPPIVSAAATQPRPVAPVQPSSDGPIASAAAQAPATPAAPTMTDAERNNAPFHQSYLRMQDQNRVDAANADAGQQSAREQVLSAANQAESRMALEKAQHEASQAGFLAKYGVVGSRAARLADAGAANARVAGAQQNFDTARAANVVAGRRDPLGDLAKGQAVVQSGARSRLDDQRAQSLAALEQQKTEQQARINQLGATLADPKSDPKARDQASQALLSILGKDKPEDYTVIHAAGAETLSPDGLTKTKGADSIVIVNKRTGAREIVQLGQQQQAGQQFTEGQMYTDKNGNKAVYRNGKFVPA